MTECCAHISKENTKRRERITFLIVIYCLQCICDYAKIKIISQITTINLIVGRVREKKNPTANPVNLIQIQNVS